MKSISVSNNASTTNTLLGRSKPGISLRAALVACAALFCSLGAAAAQANNPVQLFVFSCVPGSQNNTCADGSNPNSLIQASDGNFYGTTQSSEFPGFQGGTIFKFTPAGQFTLLFTFSPNPQGNFLNGNLPDSGLVEGTDGFLFGTTATGGANGQGVVFRINKQGKNFQVLHSFCSRANCTDGALPLGLTMGDDGSLVGTTLAGGTQSAFCAPGGCGTIFHITESGTFKLLHAFNFASDGGTPLFGLLNASDGNFYGLDQGNNDNGNIFRVTPSGSFSVVLNLPGTDLPVAGLVQASNGSLFGASENGEGATSVQLFTLKTNGTGFQAFPPSFDIPVQGQTFPDFIQASDGNLWSVFPDNGTSGDGSVFSVNLTGTLLQSISFEGTNGSGPNTQLVQNTDGTLLGTTASGGTIHQGDVSGGTIFTLNQNLPAPLPVIAAFSPATGTVGTKVVIRGANFVGTKTVTFNGVSGTFQVLNSQFLVALVPAGATSGPIAVTNLGGTAFSKRSFEVQ